MFIPLKNGINRYWFIAIYSGFSHWKWWFSIVYVNVYQRVSITIISINILQCPASDIWRLSQMFQIFPSNYCWYMTSSYFNWWHEGGPFLMGNLPSLAGEINQLRVVLSTRCLSQIKNLLRRFPFFCWLYRVPDWFSLLLATFQFFFLLRFHLL